MNEIKYVVIQAGGKGTRLGKLTMNKPKALVSYKGKPYIFNTFEKFKNAKIIIIGDYKFNTLRNYIQTFAKKYNISLIKTKDKGTISGINAAMKLIPNNKEFVLTWCDLIIGIKEKIDINDKNIIKLSSSFPCRWQYNKNKFSEIKSNMHGVAGLFIFKSKKVLKNLPKQGEFVRWLKDNKIDFDSEILVDTIEIGTTDALREVKKKHVSRPFNVIEINNDYLTKRPINQYGIEIAKKEVNWYRNLEKFSFDFIPKTSNYSPLTMKYIKHVPLENIDLNNEKKLLVFKKIVNNIKKIHNLKRLDVNINDVFETYFYKTVNRIKEVKKLIPFTNKKIIKINNNYYKNPFFHLRKIKRIIRRIMPKVFTYIHGDITFSNILLESKTEKVFFIDPRGYFGKSLLYGDPMYDWAKLYYSIIGNYDQFNKKQFNLKISETEVELEIEKNNWNLTSKEFFYYTKTNPYAIKFLHGIIWLSLTTYCWDDYDSICGAFYKGCIELGEYL